MRKRHESNGGETEYLIEDLEEHYNKRKHNVHSVHPSAALIILVYLVILFSIAHLIDKHLPTPLKVSDEVSYPDAFITERAQKDLKELIDIGPRVVGTYENEYLAVNLLKSKILEIQQQAHPNQRLELDIQISNGSFYLDFRPYGAINVYRNTQNALVKLHSKKKSKHSLLVNTHFDTVPGSPGGSDTGILCAIALEILRKVSRLPEPPEHNIIFLFNGAKETALQGSHSFVQYHRWANEVKVLVNIDAGGAGGKEFLKQTVPGYPWLLKYYQKVPHPYGQVAGEEWLQSGVVRLDTDFRIFRDMGKMIGLDFVFYEDGYRYHTSIDGISNIQLGSYQHAGDNMLSLIKNLANADELSDPHGQPKGNMIFYDILELVVIIYSQMTSVIITIITCFISIVIFFKSLRDFGLKFSFASLKYLSLNFLALVLSLNVSGLIAFAIATIMDILNLNMRWFNSVWLLVGLYGAPIISCYCTVFVVLNKFFNKSFLGINIQTQLQLHLVRFFWTIVLGIGTYHGVRSMYSFLILVIFQTLAAGVIQAFSFQHSVKTWRIIYILGSAIPTLFLMKQAEQIVPGFIPICGRLGSQHNSEMFAAVLCLVIIATIIPTYVPLITLVHKPRIILRALIGIFLLSFLIALTPLTFPYSNNPESATPQRFLIYHTSRVFHDDANNIYKNDSGYVIFHLDRNSPQSIKSYVTEFSSRSKPIVEDCKNSLLCGISVMDPRLIGLLPYSSFIPAEQPITNDTISLKLNSKTKIKPSVTRFDFTASGPSQITFYISARPGTRLLNTNLVSRLPPNPIKWNDRLLYLVTYTWGKEKSPLDLTLDFETSTHSGDKPVFDIAMIGNYKDDKTNVKTPQFLQFLRGFPEWTDKQVWLSMYESWVY